MLISHASAPLDLSRPQEFLLPDDAATQALGALMASGLRAGDVLYLTGELGMGKSTLARAIIRTLTSSDQDVPSPTFTLMQTYEAAEFQIVHLDLYRLTSPEDTYELGLDEAQSFSLFLIEWPDRLAHLGFDDRLDIVLDEGDKTNFQSGRRVRLTPKGRFRD